VIQRESLLRRLGLDRPELRAWAMYDWANSAFVTTVITTVYPIYYGRVAGRDLPIAEAQERFFTATAIAMTVSALVSPWLGAVADATGRVKRMLGASLAVALASTAALFFVGPGDWLAGAVLFGIANIGASASFVFYDALLPHVARDDEVDRVSTAGYALGYVGGGLLLVLNLAWISNPQAFGLPSGERLSDADATLPARLAFLSVALWWLLFSIPLFRRVEDPPPRGLAPRAAFSAAFAQLRASYRGLRAYPQAFLMLCAFLLFNDGIGTVFRAGVPYADALSVPQSDLLLAIVLVQFVGVPCAFAFGAVAHRVGVKRAILVALAAYVVIVVFAFFLRTTAQFYVMALAIATVQGGAQALSRSLFASLVPRERAAEFFGFFSVVEKFAGVAGPALFALTLHLAQPFFPEGSTTPLRLGVLSVLPFFLAGMALLSRVDVSRGREQARSRARTSI
jgi:MFS transporter, UMF1 family